jgi:hypothetical protein
MDYIKNIAIGVDQLLNTFLLGSPDETLSSRAYRAYRDGKILGKIFRPVINCMFFWQKDHCFGAYLSEVQRRQYPATFR